MTNFADPAAHRRIELRLIEHVQSLLDDPKLRIDTTSGTRPVAGLRRKVARTDHSADVRKLVGQLSRDDSANTANLPQGELLDVTFGRSKAIVLFSPVARLRLICTSPLKQLIKGEDAKPMTVGELNRMLEEHKVASGVPTTIVLLSTGGFSQDTHDAAQRMATRTLVLVEPNDAGGFNVWGPSETKALNDLIDPEPAAEKRTRVRDAVQRSEKDLGAGGIGVDRIATETRLPISIVEDEFKSIAKTESLRTQRLDGRLVLYRQGATLTGSAGGAAMSMVDRVRSIFSARSGNEKKIAYLTERRDSIGMQRDALDQELALLEKKDAYLRQQFQDAGSEPARRRAAAQLHALRKRLESRQQMMSVLNQQLNVVSIHLGNLEKLPAGENMSGADVESLSSALADAEEMLAKMAARDELEEAESPGLSGGALVAEEQAVYDELQGEGS